MAEEMDVLKEDKTAGDVFALDIGTRSIIGMVGHMSEGRIHITAIEKENHNVRAMIDGQIEDIELVARAVRSVKKKLEEKSGHTLNSVYVAAAGRALKTQMASYEMELESPETVTEDIIRTLEAGAITLAEEAFDKEDLEQSQRRFYLVGYTVKQYYLDHYPISSLLDHKGKQLGVDVIATFLPSEVVDSLYRVMSKADLETAGLTLEPIASMNAAIPKNLRLLNLVLVDIGAGTSDIAAAREGSICGYTMATVAGDEITEFLMKEYLIDFETAERLKIQMGDGGVLSYCDVLGFGHEVDSSELSKKIGMITVELSKQIGERILEVNGSIPSAVFLVGGGSKLPGLREEIASALGMDLTRVALGGNQFSVHACSDEYELDDPEYSTPLGIAVSAGLNLINDSFYVRLNGERAKLFRNGRLTIRDVLLMNGFSYRHFLGRSGQNLRIEVEGKTVLLKGNYALPAELLLNGSPAAISEMVHAGDEIAFIPARDGEDARGTVADVIPVQYKGSIRWKDDHFMIGFLPEKNGCITESEVPLQAGDKIRLLQIETLGEFLAYHHIDQAVLVNGKKVPLKQLLADGDLLTEASGGESQTDKEKIHFQLNDKDVFLDSRGTGEPYLLMELLPMTGMSFENPEGIIDLWVNGQEANFQTELKDGDRVDILWTSR